MLWLAIALFGCNGKDSAPAADDSTPIDDSGDDTATPAVDIDWGVVDSCGTSAPAGFNDFYEDGTALVVYGDEESEFVSRFVGWYGKYVWLDVRAYADLSEADKQENLFVLGSPASNPLLTEMNGSLPVWFEDGAFVFGGRRYDEHGNGIAFIHPSPFAAGKWIVAYAGNSFEGMYSTFTIWTGAADFETTRGRGALLQEGKLCREGAVWGWNTDLVSTDDWPTWESWLGETEELVTAHHVFRYLPDSYAAANIDWSSEYQEDRYEDVLDRLEIEPLDEPITSHLYPDNAKKGAITGEYGNGHANDLNYENHMVFGEDLSAMGSHEDVHVIAWHRIGEGQYALLGEGLAVAMDGEWWGESLSSWASKFAGDGSLPSLADLENDFWSIDDTTTYPVAGYFVEWLLDTYGADAVKALYVAPDLDAAFESELGLTHDEVEKAWLASIP